MKEIVQVLNLNERGNFHRVPKIAFFQLRDSGTSFELESNQCADVLANYGCNMDVGSVFFDVCPNAFSHLPLADVLHITTPHLIPM
jgi:hypothetical protein